MKRVFAGFERMTFEGVVNDLGEERSEFGQLERRGQDEGFRVAGERRVRVEDEEFVNDG